MSLFNNNQKYQELFPAKKLFVTDSIELDVIAKYVCALLNNSGGIIIIEFINVMIPVDPYVKVIEQQILQSLQPLPPILITIDVLFSQKCVLIHVPIGFNGPYVYQRTLYSFNELDVFKVSAQELPAFIHKKNELERRWDREWLPSQIQFSLQTDILDAIKNHLQEMQLLSGDVIRNKQWEQYLEIYNESKQISVAAFWLLGNNLPCLTLNVINKLNDVNGINCFTTQNSIIPALNSLQSFLHNIHFNLQNVDNLKDYVEDEPNFLMHYVLHVVINITLHHIADKQPLEITIFIESDHVSVQLNSQKSLNSAIYSSLTDWPLASVHTAHIAQLLYYYYYPSLQNYYAKCLLLDNFSFVSPIFAASPNILALNNISAIVKVLSPSTNLNQNDYKNDINNDKVNELNSISSESVTMHTLVDFVASKIDKVNNIQNTKIDDQEISDNAIIDDYIIDNVIEIKEELIDGTLSNNNVPVLIQDPAVLPVISGQSTTVNDSPSLPKKSSKKSKISSNLNDNVNNTINKVINDSVFEIARSLVYQDVHDNLSNGVKQEMIKIVVFLYSNPGTMSYDIIAALGRPKPTVDRYIANLKNKNIIEFKGAPKSGGYFLHKKVLKLLQKAADS